MALVTMDEPSGKPTILEARGISKRFGSIQALDGVDLQVAPGEIVAYVGPNGSGKTTTLRAAVGLVRLDRGELRLFGHDAFREYSAVGHRVGAVFDQQALHPDLTVRETLTLYAELLGVQRAVLRRRVDEVIDAMGLEDRAGARAKRLSKGLRQRLAVGRALVHSPELLLLDEPFDGIDTETHRHLRRLLRHLAAEGVGILLASHDLPEVEQLASTVVILDGGRVRATGSPAALRFAVGGSGIALVFQEPVTEAVLKEILREFDGPHEIRLTEAGREATIRPLSAERLDRFVACLVARGLRLREFRPLASSLEDAYFSHVASARGASGAAPTRED